MGARRAARRAPTGPPHAVRAAARSSVRVGRTSTSSEYPYGCTPGARVGRLGGMTTHRAPKPLAAPERPVERAVNAALILAVLAGLGWIVGMIYTLVQWPL